MHQRAPMRAWALIESGYEVDVRPSHRQDRPEQRDRRSAGSQDGAREETHWTNTATSGRGNRDATP